MSSLTVPDRGTLLRMARGAIGRRLNGDPAESPRDQAKGLSGALHVPGCSFVTLRQPDRSLRGCVGSTTADEPLYRNVTRNAVHAAFDDPRFPAVEAGELGTLVISISVLTPRQSVASADLIEIGTHGVDLRHGTNRAVFLPDVAVQAGWDREQLLEQLAIKAGLPADGWRSARLAVFRTDSFGE